MNNHNEIIELLVQIEGDNSVPKNIKVKIKKAITILGEQEEEKVKINKVLSELDDVAEDLNVPQFTRTQIWQVVSLLEGNK